jgi:hypothetical protein
VNAQVIADPAGRLLRISAVLPASTHDLTATRAHGVHDVPDSTESVTYADRACQGADRHIRVPIRGAASSGPALSVGRRGQP